MRVPDIDINSNVVWRMRRDFWLWYPEALCRVLYRVFLVASAWRIHVHVLNIPSSSAERGQIGYVNGELETS